MKRKKTKSLGCKGFARFDYIVTKENDFYCLEINTIPGLAEGSNFTVVCRKIGLQYEDILINLLYTAMN